MFGRVKGLKNISVDSEKSHLTLKKTNFPLVIMRPYDLVQLGAMAANGSEDILIWIGKRIGKNLAVAVQKNKNEKKREKLIKSILETLSQMGFGEFDLNYNEGEVAKISVANPISNEIADKEDARVLCNLYNGLFSGMFSGTGVEVEGDEIECRLDGQKKCVFEMKFEED